jgi:hypothetical protein
MEISCFVLRLQSVFDTLLCFAFPLIERVFYYEHVFLLRFAKECPELNVQVVLRFRSLLLDVFFVSSEAPHFWQEQQHFAHVVLLLPLRLALRFPQHGVLRLLVVLLPLRLLDVQ